MKEIDKEPEKTIKQEQTAEALPTGLSEGTPFDLQTVEAIGISHVKKFAKIFLNADDQNRLEQISEVDFSSCVDFLSSLDYKQNSHFLNVIHRASFACSNDGASALIACGASKDHNNTRDIIFESCLTNPDLFNRVVDELIAKHPFPKKAYRLFQKKNGASLNMNFTDAKIKSLETVLEKLFAEKGCVDYAKVRIQNNKHMIGLMLEHATPENHYSTLDTKEKPVPSYSALRMRVSDFVWVDKYNKMLWIKSTLMTKNTKNRFLEALGAFLCDDPTVFLIQHTPSMGGFNSPALESNLKGFNIPGIKKVELREFYYRKIGVTSGNKHQVSGPEEKGCVTEIANWTHELPAQWQTSSVSLIYETISGERESISFNSRSINLDHTPNLPLTIALLKHLKVIPNNDN